MTMRLSIISFAGTVRTLVAVGTREAGVHVGRERLAHALERGDDVLGLGPGSSPSVDRGAGASAAPRPGSAAACAGTEVVRRDRGLAGGRGIGAGGGRLGAARRRGCGGDARRGAAAPSAGRRGAGRASGRSTPGGSSRGSATSSGRPSSCRRGTARTSRRRAIRWLRIRLRSPSSGTVPVTWLDTADRPLSVHSSRLCVHG